MKYLELEEYKKHLDGIVIPTRLGINKSLFVHELVLAGGILSDHAPEVLSNWMDRLSEKSKASELLFSTWRDELVSLYRNLTYLNYNTIRTKIEFRTRKRLERVFWVKMSWPDFIEDCNPLPNTVHEPILKNLEFGICTDKLPNAKLGFPQDVIYGYKMSGEQAYIVEYIYKEMREDGILHDLLLENEWTLRVNRKIIYNEYLSF